MRNDTPIDPSAGEGQARAQAEAALKEYGWLAITPRQRWESELAVGLSPDHRYEIGAWADTGELSGGDTCICDVGAAFSAEKRSLWTLGIPSPDEVPTLLNQHAEIMSVGMGTHLLSLATNEVVDRVAERDRKLASIRNTLGAAWRKLPRCGWETYEPDYSFGRGSDAAGRSVEVQALPLYDGVGGTLMLHLRAYYAGDEGEVWTYDRSMAVATTGLPTEYYGRAACVLPLPGGARDIPTPEEAVSIMGTA